MKTHEDHDPVQDKIAAKMPPSEATGSEGEPLIRVRSFTPDSFSNWLKMELRSEERLSFGLVIGPGTELGHLSPEELEELRSPDGLLLTYDLERPSSQAQRKEG